MSDYSPVPDAPGGQEAQYPPQEWRNPIVPPDAPAPLPPGLTLAPETPAQDQGEQEIFLADMIRRNPSAFDFSDIPNADGSFGPPPVLAYVPYGGVEDNGQVTAARTAGVPNPYALNSNAPSMPPGGPQGASGPLNGQEMARARVPALETVKSKQEAATGQPIPLPAEGFFIAPPVMAIQRRIFAALKNITLAQDQDTALNLLAELVESMFLVELQPGEPAPLGENGKPLCKFAGYRFVSQDKDDWENYFDMQEIALLIFVHMGIDTDKVTDAARPLA